MGGGGWGVEGQLSGLRVEVEIEEGGGVGGRGGGAR